MTRSSLVVAFVLAFRVICSSGVYAAALPDPTGTYSSLSIHPETGDLLGTEIIVVATKMGFYVVFMESEGEMDVPIVAPATIIGSTLSFRLPAAPGESVREFTGKFSDDQLVGRFKGGIERRLAKGKSFWR